ncbi:uncharacterized protein LY89DRAFT_727262 [Mollisia scopiformis]|uniref:SAP domain-containing protein n=1 Tax=Mollisia scopiformis TaxID=149040 RepID=A0A194XV73_MOLSC|nr:uncharacterized protein LY89DRAFT_727262 [Mollisia scopiformis]KUJ24230.1 hypothetical protein LY89DRAFT_727262 [Mollisia scopiformis]
MDPDTYDAYVRYADMWIEDLRALCRSLGVDSHGNQAELIQGILEHDARMQMEASRNMDERLPSGRPTNEEIPLHFDHTATRYRTQIHSTFDDAEVGDKLIGPRSASRYIEKMEEKEQEEYKREMRELSDDLGEMLGYSAKTGEREVSKSENENSVPSINKQNEEVRTPKAQRLIRDPSSDILFPEGKAPTMSPFDEFAAMEKEKKKPMNMKIQMPDKTVDISGQAATQATDQKECLRFSLVDLQSEITTPPDGHGEKVSPLSF